MVTYSIKMSFLSGPRLDLLAEYRTLKQFRGRHVIPFGPQELKIAKKEIAVSKREFKMIVLTIRKPPMEIENTKIGFHPILLYFGCDIRNRAACNVDGVPFGLIELKRFIQETFHITLEKRKPLLEGIIDQIPKDPFWAVMRYRKQVVIENGELKEKAYVRRRSEFGLPVIYYRPEILRTAPTLEKLKFSKMEYKNLIIGLNHEEQELFNQKMENRGTS